MEKSAPAQLSKAIQCKCISKQRDKNNRIINYILQDNYGKTPQDLIAQYAQGLIGK